MKRSNRTLRSVLSLLLAVAMCLTLALPALAAGGETTFDGVYRLLGFGIDIIAVKPRKHTQSKQQLHSAPTSSIVTCI